MEYPVPDPRLHYGSELFILYYGGSLVLNETFQIGELIQFSAYAGLIYGPLQFMSFIPRWFHQAMTSAERLFEIVDTVPAIQDKPEAVPIPELKGEIRLENVTFGYRPYEPVLKNVNLHIKPGETLVWLATRGRKIDLDQLDQPLLRCG